MSKQSGTRLSPAGFNSWPQEWRKDLPVLFGRKRKREREDRATLWSLHVTTLAAIACPGGSWGAKRIDILVSHLDILDRRFGALLQFQGLLATVAVFSLSPFSTTLRALSPVSSAVLITFAFIWYANTYQCLRGLGRVIWGDLWLYPDDPAAAEQAQVARLIDSVVIRTARFRFATLLLVLNLFLVAVWILIRWSEVAGGRIW